MYHIDGLASAIMASTRTISTYTTYNLWVMALYIILLPVFLIWTPDILRYGFSTNFLGILVVAVSGSLLGFFLLNKIFPHRGLDFRRTNLAQLFRLGVYALAFSIPEEIIFRGLIQGALENAIGNAFVAIIISAAIFGIAHLPNGMHSLHPQDWSWRLAALCFFAGLPLGFLYSMTGNLLMPTLLHAILLVCFKTFIDTKPVYE